MPTLIRRLFGSSPSTATGEGATTSERGGLDTTTNEDVESMLGTDPSTTRTTQSRPPPPPRNTKRQKVFLSLLLLFTTLIAVLVYFLQQNPDVISRYTIRPATHPSYQIVQTDHLEEYDLNLVLYKHSKTQAQFLAVMPTHVADKDDKAFGISFRTPPSDSSGAPHVLEHSVLCGSTSYPVKDPFLYLLRGSLQTFLNAMTYPDRTVYAIASRNSKDYQNLMSVYLDAVFEPNVAKDSGEWILRQEGWRFEVEDDELVYKGVVLSEMKGVYSDPEELLTQYTFELLFPDNPYQYDSGGNPQRIPDLNHYYLKEFYRKFYHPSNSQIIIYGNRNDVYFGLSKADVYLSKYEERLDLRTSSRVDYQTKWFTSPVMERRAYPVHNSDDDGGGGDDAGGTGGNASGEGGGDYMIVITWLLNSKPFTQVEELGWIVLDQLLIGTTTSVLRKALMDSKLGSDLVGGGLENYLIQSTFAVGLKGIQQAIDVSKVEDIVMNTLASVQRRGFDADDVESAVNTVEFQLREFNTGSTPRGISIILETLNKWNYDFEPKSALAFEDALGELKGKIADGSPFFQSLIKNYLLDNNHRVVLELYPDNTLGQKEVQSEKDRLSIIKKSFTPAEYQKIVDEAKSLEQLQSTEDPPNAVASIPSLTLADLDREGVEYPISTEENAYGSGVTLVTHRVGSSSGIAYVDFGLDISMLNFDDVPLLPLFNRMMTEAGTKQLSDVQLERRIGMYTGGVSVSTLILPVRPNNLANHDETVVTGGTNMKSMLFIRGKCTSDKSSNLFDIYAQLLNDTNLDAQDKVVLILKEIVADLKSDIQSSGHVYANYRIKSHYSPQRYINELLEGVTKLEMMESALSDARNAWPDLLTRLEDIRSKILRGNREGAILNLTGDSSVLTAIREDVKRFLQGQLPPSSAETSPLQDFSALDHPWVVTAVSRMASPANEGIVVPTQVSYVGKGGIIYKKDDVVPGSTAVVSRYLEKKYLWEIVRVKNGAYGAFASLDTISGTFSMLSYRDPSLLETLAAYDNAASDLLAEVSTTLPQNNASAVTMAVVGTIGRLDGSALPPDQVGWVSLTRWLSGETASVRQKWRDDVLNTKITDFTMFANKLKTWSSTSVAIVSSQSSFDGGVSDQLSMKLINVS